MKDTFLKISIFLFVSLSIYFIQIGFKKSYVFQFTLSSMEIKKPIIDIYYASNNHGYSEHKKLHLNKVRYKNTLLHTYTYTIPDIEKSVYLRLDPSRAKGSYSLSQVQVIEKTWISLNTYNIPLKYIQAVQHIQESLLYDKKLKFNVIDDDPQFKIVLGSNLENLKLSKSWILYAPHVDAFLISIILTTILFMFYYIYRNIKKIDRLKTFLRLSLYSTFFIFAFIQTSHYINTVVAFHPPDESQHLAYVKYLHQNNTPLIPKFEDIRNLYDTGYNYLGHPPLYYHILNFAFNKDVTTNMNLPLFRYVSSLIFLLSFLLLLYFGWQMKLSFIADIVFLSVLSSVPLYSYIGASINNDVLAIFAASLFFVSFLQLVKKRYTNTTYALLGLATLIAYFSKLTIVIFIFFTLFFYLIYLVYKKSMIQINIKQLLILSIFALPVIYYQSYIYLEYNSLMPSFNIIHPEEFLKSGYYIDEAKKIYLSGSEWFIRMSQFSFVGWFNIQSHHYFFKSNWIDYIGVVTIHLFAIASLFLKCSEQRISTCIVGKVTLLAFMSVFVVQYIFTYSNHLHYGYMGGIQSRYLLPFLPAFAIMSAILVNRFAKSKWLQVFILLLCMHAIYSNFFYFLLYYK